MVQFSAWSRWPTDRILATNLLESSCVTLSCPIVSQHNPQHNQNLPVRNDTEIWIKAHLGKSSKWKTVCTIPRKVFRQPQLHKANCAAPFCSRSRRTLLKRSQAWHRTKRKQHALFWGGIWELSRKTSSKAIQRKPHGFCKTESYLCWIFCLNQKQVSLFSSSVSFPSDMVQQMHQSQPTVAESCLSFSETMSTLSEKSLLFVAICQQYILTLFVFSTKDRKLSRIDADLRLLSCIKMDHVSNNCWSCLLNALICTWLMQPIGKWMFPLLSSS